MNKEFRINLASKIRIISILILCIVHIANKLTISSEILYFAITIVAIAFIIFTLPFISSGSKYMTWGVLLFALIVLILSNAPLSIWAKALRTNTDLIAIIVFAPLFGIAVKQRNYKDVIEVIYHKYLNRGNQLYLFNKMLSFSLSSILNIGALPFVHAMTPSFNKRSNHTMLNYLLCTSLGRGFFAALIISPVTANVGLVTRSLELSWVELAGLGIGLPAIMIISGYYMEFRQSRNVFIKESFNKTKGNGTNDSGYLLKLAELILFILFSLFTVLLLQYLTSWSILTVVPVVALFISSIWVVIASKSFIRYFQHIKSYVCYELDKMKDIIALFLAAGFLATAISNTEVVNQIPRFINAVGGNHALIISLVISFPIIISALLGVHPLVTMNIILAVMSPFDIGVTPLFLALVLLTGSTIGSVMSPFSGYNMVLALLYKEPLMKVSLRWNLLFSAVNYVLLISYIYVLSYFKLL